MRNRDLGQIEVLGRQLYGKSKAGVFVDRYKKSFVLKYIRLVTHRFRTESTSRITTPY